MKIKIHALIVTALLLLIWILGVVALASSSWLKYSTTALGYTSTANYGLTKASACLLGTCVSVSYSDFTTTDSSNVSRLKAAGGLALFFGLLNIFSLMLLGFLFLLDAVFDVEAVGSKVPKIYERISVYFRTKGHREAAFEVAYLPNFSNCLVDGVSPAGGSGLIVMVEFLENLTDGKLQVISIILTVIAIVAYMIVGKFIVGVSATPVKS